MKAVDICSDLMRTVALPFISAIKAWPVFGLHPGRAVPPESNWASGKIERKWVERPRRRWGDEWRQQGRDLALLASVPECASSRPAVPWKEGALCSWTGLAGSESWPSAPRGNVGSRLSSPACVFLCQRAQCSRQLLWPPTWSPALSGAQ